MLTTSTVYVYYKLRQQRCVHVILLYVDIL